MTSPRPFFRPAALLLLVPLLAAGCAPLPLLITPTASQPPPTATLTIQWFPSTRTPSPFIFITPSATLEPLPGLGPLLFSDDFTDASLWNTASSGQASAQVEAGRLALALASGPLSIASLRSGPVLEDFYLEVTASTSLCQAGDQYGVLLRASPGGNHYRLVLDCNGSLRLERVRGGAAEILQNWIPSGDVPRGAPAEVRIGVWASGPELRFLLDDHLQFSLRDPVFRLGTFGFYAYASGGTPVLVSFSGLQVHAVSYISPTPSRTPTITPTP